MRHVCKTQRKTLTLTHFGLAADVDLVLTQGADHLLLTFANQSHVFDCGDLGEQRSILGRRVRVGCKTSVCSIMICKAAARDLQSHRLADARLFFFMRVACYKSIIRRFAR